MGQEELLLELLNVSKIFPGVNALDNVSLTLKRGEILGLVGENGAGKSTLIRIITGVYPRDKGIIRLNGNEVEMRSPYEAKVVHKIAYVSQESTLCPDLTVAENIALGAWKKGKNHLVDWKAVNDFAVKALQKLGLDIAPNILVRDLKSADRQLVEIARALSFESEILLLDEPTSWLSENEKNHLFERVSSLKTHGVGIIFISHFLDEVLTLCDRVQVLRDGKYVGVFEKQNLTKSLLIEKMLGEKKSSSRGSLNSNAAVSSGKVALKVENITKKGQVEDISFELHEGEILGIAGLLGSGKSELARIIFGITKPDTGSVSTEKAEQKWVGIKHSVNIGLGFASEDRKLEGIVPLLTIANNITLTKLKSITRLWKSILDLTKELNISKQLIKIMNVHPDNPKQKIVNLSGGNQQKVVIAKWLHADSKVLILDEPTRGIDVGAKFEIYNLLQEQAKSGKAIIFISSELEEILGVPHRFLVLKKGKVFGEYKNGEIKDEHQLLSILSS